MKKNTKNSKFNFHKSLFLFSIVFGAVFLFSGKAHAKEYYVKSDGNDNLDGLSDATAWKTINKVNSFSFQQGDDVYFKCNGEWKYESEQWISGQSLKIDWEGTKENRVIIGAYYDNGIIGVKDKRPIINGNDKVPGEWGYLIEVKGNYTDIENIAVLNSEGGGIRVENSYDNNIRSCYIKNTLRRGLGHFSSDTGIVEDNELDDCARFKEEQGPYYSASLGPSKSKNLIIRNNIVHDTHGEGINIYNQNSDITVEKNIVYNVRSVGIYVDSSNNVTVRNNIVFNNANRTYWRNKDPESGYPGGGIWMTVEPSSPQIPLNNVRIYNNLVAFCHGGLTISGGKLKATNIKVYNNILVDNTFNLKIWSSDFEDTEVRNNIFLCTVNDCKQVGEEGNGGKILFSNNLWSSPVIGPVVGANDIIADPNLTKKDGWRNIDPNIINPNWWKPLEGSPAIDKGASLGSPYNIDYTGVTRPQGLVWDIGAFENAGNPSLPSVPTGLVAL